MLDRQDVAATNPDAETDTPGDAADCRAFPDLSETEYHSLLSSARRRIALAALAGRERPVSLDGLAVAVSARETNTPVSEVTADESVALSLHHQHLPKMDALGVLEYDPKTRQVR